jgi:hypothetical protein
MHQHQLSKLASITAYFLLTLTAITGCSAGARTADSDKSGEDQVKTVSYSKMQQEYSKSVSKLSWPEGYTPPKETPGEDKDTQYQLGYGDGRASIYYECAWEKDWLHSYASDPERAKKAIAALEKVPSMDYMKEDSADDATREFFKDYLDRAKLDDPSGFQENVDANCD